MDQLLDLWPTSSVDSQERARRLIDLFMVSVLLDAGAGTEWRYKSKENGRIYTRSEGLAVASIEMFKAGAFSGNPSEPFQVDAAGLKALNTQTMAKGLQVGPNNPIEGLEGRTGLLIRLGDALRNKHEIFGETERPGNMLGMSNCLSVAFSCPLNTLFRLPSLSSNDTSRWKAHHQSDNTLGHTHGRPCSSLATFSHQARRCLSRGCLALQHHATKPSPTLGIHCALPQAHAMALLLAHGAHPTPDRRPF